MDNLKCQYNMDSGFLEVTYDDGCMLSVNCSEIEENLNTNIVTRSRLQWLLDNDPFSYLEMALSFELQEYCNHIEQQTMEQNQIIQKQLLDNNYTERSAQCIISDFNRYDR